MASLKLNDSADQTHSFIAEMVEGEERMMSVERMNCAHQGDALPGGFMDFLLPLHQVFTPRQQEIVARRAEMLVAAQAGQMPDHLPPAEAATGDWQIELPDWCQDQRNQMTGP